MAQSPLIEMSWRLQNFPRNGTLASSTTLNVFILWSFCHACFRIATKNHTLATHVR